MSNEKPVKNTSNEVTMSISGMKIPKPSIQPSGAVPPGLSSPQDFPPLAAPQPVAAPKLQKKVTGSNLVLGMIKPIVPVLPGQQSRTLAPTKENREILIAQKLEDTSGAPCSTKHESVIEATVARPIAKPKLKAKQSAIGSSRKNAQSKSGSSEVPTPNLAAAEPKPLSISVSENFHKLTEKRPHPGKLDITAAKDASKIEMESIASSSAQSKSVDPAAPFSAISQPLTPATSLSSAPRHIQSRAIRVISTPKTENPPRLITASPSIVSVAASTVASKQISRRASLSSIHPPGTPVSEKISDNASFTSTSMSRANSPPPSKVGSAPVRQYTKSQQRKERQVRARQAEEGLMKKEDSSTKAIAEEPVQAPIIGRKKKTKKPTRGTTDSTPVATRPSSPTPHNEKFQDRTRPATPIKESYNKEISFQKDAKEPETPASPVASSGSDNHQKNLLSAASILSSLQKSGDVSSTLLDLFKGVPGINFRFEINQQDLAEQNIPVLSDAQRRQIESGGAVVLDMINNKRVILLPDHSTLPGLTEEEAQRYLELRQRILSSTELAKFSSTRCDIARYLHDGPQPANTAPPKPIRGCSAPEGLSVLINRFVASASAPALAAATFPPYFNSAPLTDEGMQRAKDVQFETAEQDMLATRKETEICEKKFNGLLKRNRRLLVGNSN